MMKTHLNNNIKKYNWPIKTESIKCKIFNVGVYERLSRGCRVSCVSSSHSKPQKWMIEWNKNEINYTIR
jgi:hypothetical protein